VRSTNAGITCMIDPNGRILRVLAPFTEGCLVGSVPVVRGRTTLYTAWGDWLPWVLLAFAGAAIAAGTFLRLTGRGNWSRMSRNEASSPNPHR
jgi:apolipoprotein N-acyltransferase